MIATENSDKKKENVISGTRAYVLLQSLGNQHNKVVRTLKLQTGVVAVDLVEGPPDIVMVIEAPDRHQLASILMSALSSVQDITEGMELLPARMKRQKNLKAGDISAEG